MTRVLFGCISEDRPGWYERVANLVLSVRGFGGPLADAPVVAGFVDSVDEAARRRLEALGAEVCVVPRFDARNPYANKLRMLEFVEDHDFDVLVMLDCDVLVMGDLTPYLSTTAVAAKPADLDRLTDAEWLALFAALRVPVPERSTVATTSGQAMYPYFNSGVIFVPAAVCRALLRSWTTLIAELFTLYETQPDLVPKHYAFHADQLSLSCALLRDAVPARALPVSLNYPTHISVHPAVAAAAPPPLILHYHKDFTPSGVVMRSRTRDAAVDALVARFDAYRAERLGEPFRGVPGVPFRSRAKTAAFRAVRRLRSYQRRVTVPDLAGGRRR